MDVTQSTGDPGGRVVRRLQTSGIGSEDCRVGLIAPIFVITCCPYSLLLFLFYTFFCLLGFS